MGIATGCQFRRRDVKTEMVMSICNFKRVSPRLAKDLLRLGLAALKEIERREGKRAQ